MSLSVAPLSLNGDLYVVADALEPDAAIQSPVLVGIFPGVQYAVAVGVLIRDQVVGQYLNGVAVIQEQLIPDAVIVVYVLSFACDCMGGTEFDCSVVVYGSAVPIIVDGDLVGECGGWTSGNGAAGGLAQIANGDVLTHGC